MQVPEAKHPIAVVGAGPAGLFAVEALMKRPNVHVDVFERLVAPFGLVRYGVAPDHQKIKQVESGFMRTLSDPRVRYFGNVALGSDLELSELLRWYDQVVLAMGCQAPKLLGVTGESLPGVHSALEVVSWYNGHPDFLQAPIELGVSSVAIVGAGDVSMDLARLFASSASELAATDMPEYAQRQFSKNQLRDIHVLIRRGPESANFALKELRAVLERDLRVSCNIELLDATLSDPDLPTAQRQKLEWLKQRVLHPPALQSGTQLGGSAPRLHFHFLRSPVEFIARGGRLSAVRVEHNRLEHGAGAEPRATGTGQFEELDVQLAVLATGYRGIDVPSVRLDPKTGLVPNGLGRVLSEAGQAVPGLYVVGWLKRGPQGVIGTNKADARQTVERMLQDLPTPTKPVPELRKVLEERNAFFVSFEEWTYLDEQERARGAALGKPRDKWLTIDAVREALSQRAANIGQAPGREQSS